ncbi:hypothetical protein HYX70_00015 [Candidatus Saccharibacteria bacterium]|nr:hypothetical protein [Candidatus Saccharibacteria bacterium]
MQDSVNSYLRQLLTQIEEHAPTKDEQRKIATDKAGYIFDKLMRKKFRRRIGETTKKDIHEKIEVSLKEGKPLHFCMPFGGYKHYWNPSHPEPDWAELFNLRYMTDYVLPVLAVHEPGVVLEYISCDVVLRVMNNYPQAALDRYFEAFGKLIDWYSQYAPKNLKINFFRTANKYDRDRLIHQIEDATPERLKEFSRLSKDEQESEIHRSVRNIMWNGDKDLTELSEAEKRKRIILSRVIELAYYEFEPQYLGDYYTEGNHIDTWFSGGLSPDNIDESLTLAGSYGSVVDFWIGRGVLFNDGSKFRSTIISQQQYAALKNKIKTIEVKPQLVPLKNYHLIEVIENL